MSEYTDRAVELFKSGFNCSQSVFAAFSDKIGLPEETALRVSAAMGGGVGRMREVCGALLGASMLAGMVYGATEGADRAAKQKTYEAVQAIAAEFKKENPSIVCRELLGLSKNSAVTAVPQARTKDYYKKRPCLRLVACAAAAAEKVLFSNGQEE